mmetsp:Transcript_76228/g.233250  ORF Transcript_76228/g.233250 Transcript_76228/m.233250 type:complete len:267 (+) Transcript_76228:287-1087(+)
MARFIACWTTSRNSGRWRSIFANSLPGTSLLNCLSMAFISASLRCSSCQSETLSISSMGHSRRYAFTAALSPVRKAASSSSALARTRSCPPLGGASTTSPSASTSLISMGSDTNFECRLCRSSSLVYTPIITNSSGSSFNSSRVDSNGSVGLVASVLTVTSTSSAVPVLMSSSSSSSASGLSSIICAMSSTGLLAITSIIFSGSMDRTSVFMAAGSLFDKALRRSRRVGMRTTSITSSKDWQPNPFAISFSSSSSSDGTSGGGLKW